jgi:MFS family permease
LPGIKTNRSFHEEENRFKTLAKITVFFTCAPIPLMKINTWWYFAMISISGVFAVTFSVVFAYVADVTDENDRSAAYGLVSATFAASLVTSPALGAYLEQVNRLSCQEHWANIRVP